MSPEPDDLSCPLVDPSNLDRVLAAAFPPSHSRKAAASVLETVASVTGSKAGIRLRPADPAATPARLSGPSERRRLGRYELQGEIARGGLGAVFVGHDVDLGRDVAVKMLREDRTNEPAMIQRLLEEAQIGGQLQHPGIAPVYDVGLGEDLRPWFAMKLIEGRTLATLLRDRPDPSAESGRWLGVFEQVCQTIAYAHARGVVHRDLKPGNVMVGAFGEVQVVDWGLARPLESADVSRPREPDTPEVRMSGVVGTPAYMAPEQARGGQERLDERTDVFGLGAILCEILTAQPPFPGNSQEDARAMAARGDLTLAHAALAAAALDPELAAIAHTCLSPLPADRPPDAATVARLVADYRIRLEQRARDAELAAARERQRRKIAVLAAATMLLLLLAGAASWWAVAAEQRARTERAMAQIFSGLNAISQGNYGGAATIFRRLIEHDPDWYEAHLGLGRALALARDYQAAEAALRDARARGHRPDVLTWLAFVKLHTGHADEASALLEEALRLHPDDLEATIHLGMTRRQQGRLSEARKILEEVARRAPNTALVQNELARVYLLQGNTEEADRRLHEALRLDPQNATTHAMLGAVAMQGGDTTSALLHFRRAVELDPRELTSRTNLAVVLYTTDQLDSALETAQAAIDLDAKCGKAWHVLGLSHEKAKRFGKAADALQRAVELGIDAAKSPLAECSAIAAVEPRLQALLRGDEQPTDARDAQALAVLCVARSDAENGARFYELAFASGEIRSNARSHPYHHAARAAVWCGFKLPSDDEAAAARAAHWRQRAVEWLRTEVETCRAILAGDDVQERGLVMTFLRSLRGDKAFAPMHEATWDSRLTDAECEAIEALWRDVDTLLGR